MMTSLRKQKTELFMSKLKHVKCVGNGGDVALKTDSDGLEDLEYNERQTKTGCNPTDVKNIAPCI